jgi:hypothetical protein
MGSLKRFIGRTLIYEGRDYIGSRDRGDGSIDFVRPKGATAATHPYTVVTIAPEHDADFAEGNVSEVEQAIRAHMADWHKRVTSIGPAAVVKDPRRLRGKGGPKMTAEETRQLEAVRSILGKRVMDFGEDAVAHLRSVGRRRQAAGKLCFLAGAVTRPPAEKSTVEVDKKTLAAKKGAKAAPVSISLTPAEEGGARG